MSLADKSASMSVNKQRYDYEKYRIDAAKRAKARAQRQIAAADEVLRELDLELSAGKGNG